MKSSLEILCALIATPSISRQEEQVANLYEQIMIERGHHPSRMLNNLWLVSPNYSADRPTLLLNAHIDTVKPVAAWQRSPFEPTIEDGRLYGLGSNDCGGGLVSLLIAFERLTQQPQPYNLVYLASAEEEVSGANGISAVWSSLPPIDVAIVGEPTSLQPATAERGLMVLDCVAKGKAGHAARNEGLNAIYVAIDDIEHLRHFTFPRVSPLLGPVKTTTTIIEAGTQHNVIPDSCRFTIDVRVNECYSNTELLELIRSMLRSEVTPRSTRLSSSSIPDNHPLVAAVRRMGLTPFGSPTLSDQALMPCPSIKLGPGDSSRSHTADEYIVIDDLKRAEQLYFDLLNGLDLRTS